MQRNTVLRFVRAFAIGFGLVCAFWLALNLVPTVPSVPAVHAQQVPAPCSQSQSLTTTGTGPVVNTTGSGSTAGCVGFRITWYVTGFTGLTIALQGSQDNSSWANIGSTYVQEGTNPTVWTSSTGSNTIVVRAYFPYVRVNVSSVTGSGRVTWLLYGYPGTSAQMDLGGGGGPSGSCAALGGDLSGTCAAATVVGIEGHAVSGVQGNGALAQLSTGTTTTNDCVKFDANGNTVDAGSACNTGTGLTAAGFFLSDGTHYYVPVNMFPATLPVAANYSWVDQGGASETATGHALVLNAPAHSGTALRARIAAISATSTLTAAMACIFVSLDFGDCGVGFYESSSGKFETLHIAFSNSNVPTVGVFVTKWTSSTSFSSNAFVNQITGQSNTLFFQLTKTGGNISFAWSNDGVDFVTLFTEAQNAFFTSAPDNYCYFVNEENASHNAIATLYSWLAQ